MRLERANSNAKVSGIDELACKINYFIGNDPAKWRRNIPTFARVKYQQVYSGVDLVYYGNQRELEYDFVLAPGTDPRQIELSFDGADRLRLDPDGDLIVSIAGGDVIEHKPVMYQHIDGMQRLVAGAYELRNSHTVGFKLAGYDEKRSLTIDPSLVYSTYLGGGSNNDGGSGIAVDSSGNAYVTGSTASADFPTRAGAFRTTYAGAKDVFVAKLNSSGSALLYSTYLGGGNNDQGNGIAVDSSGNAYVTGDTSSRNFPTTAGAFQTSLRGDQNAFVSKLNSRGSALLYSTYLGGSKSDAGARIALDSRGDAYVTGWTESKNFPTTKGAFQTKYGGGPAFVSKLNRSGSALVYSTYLGGSNGDTGAGIALDSAGDAYVTGWTGSRNFPTTKGAFQTTYRGSVNGDRSGNAFVSKLNRSGSALLYSTYLGGSNGDSGVAIAVDSSGNAYVTGSTGSSNFPTTKGAFQTTYGGSPSDVWGDAFIAKLNRSGSALVYSTYLGGSDEEFGSGIAVDLSGNAYVTGITDSSNFPTTEGAFQTKYGGTGVGDGDAFITKLNSSGSALVYSTYLGGSNGDGGHGIAVDSSGNAYVTGSTASTNFPTTAAAFQRAGHGRGDEAFVSKLALATAVGLANFTATEAASFDCSQARSTLEVLICADPELSSLDGKVGNAYTKLRSSVPPYINSRIPLPAVKVL